MAILPDCPGAEVTVLVNGQALPEFDAPDEDNQPKTIVKYIESITNAEFEVKARFTPGFDGRYGVKMKVFVDGEKLTTPLIRKHKLFDKNGRICKGVKEWKQGRHYRSSFVFSELQIGGDSDVPMTAELENKLDRAGCIEVRLFYVKNLRSSGKLQSRRSRRGVAALNLLNFGEIPEKAISKRALSHQSRLNGAVKSRRSTFSSQYVDGRDKPIAAFIFKYRSLASLKSLRVIPRTPASPIIIEDDRRSDINVQDLINRMERMEQELASYRSIKSEPEVKREPAVKREKDPHNGDREVIVLD